MLHHLLSLLCRLISRNKLTILIYHQVLDKPDPLRPWEPDRAKFEWQMALLRRYFNPLPLAEALSLLKSNRLPPNSVSVTFDDGYLNNLTIAQPIMQRYQIPATVFVATAFSDGENMWNDQVLDLFANAEVSSLDLSAAGLGQVTWQDSEQRRKLAMKTIMALKYLAVEERLGKVKQLYRDNAVPATPHRMMSPKEVAELANLGVEIGAHTHNHPILTGLDKPALQKEISTNVALLEQWITKPIRAFAYPNGKPGVDFDEQTVEQVKDMGFDYAVTTEWGVARPDSDRFRLRRFTPWDQNARKFHLRMLLNIIKH